MIPRSYQSVTLDTKSLLKGIDTFSNICNHLSKETVVLKVATSKIR
jgi:hypothetical protein